MVGLSKGQYTIRDTDHLKVLERLYMGVKMHKLGNFCKGVKDKLDMTKRSCYHPVARLSLVQENERKILKVFTL